MALGNRTMMGNHHWTINPAGDSPSRGVWSYGPFKVAIDVAAAAALLALSWPLILALMALVRLTSRGPALYTQERLGLGDRTFTIYKIRTMAHDYERETGPCWARLTGDPRVTPLGRVLRRTHLDELPQLWNVVRGDMSLVGPRPERPEIARQLRLVVPEFEHRTAIRPGVTGLAQIQLPADTDVAGVRRKLAYDLYYAGAMGAGLDLRILVGTALKVLGLRGEAIRRLLALPDRATVLGTGELPGSEHDRMTLPQLIEVLS